MSDNHHTNAEAGRPAVRDSVLVGLLSPPPQFSSRGFRPHGPDPTKTDESLREKACPLAFA
jgi:hypothetical protein